jgi:hypothetical protein
MIKTQHCPNCEATERKLSDFQQKVSDVVEFWVNPKHPSNKELVKFIIPKPKPDPLVEIIDGLGGEWTPEDYAKEIRAALEARGLEIREKNDDQ